VANKPLRVFFQKVVLVSFVLSFTGCVAMNGKFTNSIQADIGFFTDTTVAMMRDANFGFSHTGMLYTKEFFDKTASEELEFIDRTDHADMVLKAIVRYSLRLVTIAESNDKEKDQINAYANYLSEIENEVVHELDLKRDFYDDVVKKVRKQGDLLGALRAAQPIINAMGRYMEVTLDKVTDAADVLNAKLQVKIDNRFADVIRYQQTLAKEKSDTLKALEGVYLTVRGNDKAAFDSLMESKQIRDSSLIPAGKPTYPQLTRMAEYLMKRFETMHRVSQEVDPEWQQYRATQEERERLHDRVKLEVKQFFLITLTWIRAHQKMASGKTKPAEWFDINDAPAKLINAGIKLVL
jgi:hypothetical protein